MVMSFNRWERFWMLVRIILPIFDFFRGYCRAIWAVPSSMPRRAFKRTGGTRWRVRVLAERPILECPSAEA
jgi:hypothetical protein